MLITLHNSVEELHLALSSSVVIVIVSVYNMTYYMVQMFSMLVTYKKNFCWKPP